MPRTVCFSSHCRPWRYNLGKYYASYRTDFFHLQHNFSKKERHRVFRLICIPLPPPVAMMVNCVLLFCTHNVHVRREHPLLLLLTCNFTRKPSSRTTAIQNMFVVNVCRGFMALLFRPRNGRNFWGNNIVITWENSFCLLHICIWTLTIAAMAHVHLWFDWMDTLLPHFSGILISCVMCLCLIVSQRPQHTAFPSKANWAERQEQFACAGGLSKHYQRVFVLSNGTLKWWKW